MFIIAENNFNCDGKKWRKYPETFTIPVPRTARNLTLLETDVFSANTNVTMTSQNNDNATTMRFNCDDVNFVTATESHMQNCKAVH